MLRLNQSDAVKDTNKMPLVVSRVGKKAVKTEA